VGAPLLVVVTGMPSSGKTTFAESLAERLRLPLIAKDDLKESLFDSLGAGDVAWSGRLGDAAYTLIFDLATTILAARVSMIIEANFFVDQTTRFTSLPQHRLVQIHCEAPLALLLDRYAARERHPGHHDDEKIEQLPARFESGAHAPCRCPASSFGSKHASPSTSTSWPSVCGHCSSRAAEGKRLASESGRPRVARTRSESTRYFW
jgi:predicted kinase